MTIRYYNYSWNGSELIYNWGAPDFMKPIYLKHGEDG